MTVKELITKLKDMPEDADVIFWNDDCYNNGGYVVTEITPEKDWDRDKPLDKPAFVILGSDYVDYVDEDYVMHRGKGEKDDEDADEAEDERKFNDTNPDEVMIPNFGASFHGELWYTCPRCGGSFEVYDTQFERGFKIIDPRTFTFRHTTDGCNQLIRIN